MRGSLRVSSKLVPPLLVLVKVFVIALVAIPLIPQTHAASSSPTVSIVPSTIVTAKKGALVVVDVNFTNMPVLDGFDVQVRADPGALILAGTSNSFATSSLPSETDTQTINCVSGGTGIAAGMPGIRAVRLGMVQVFRTRLFLPPSS